MPEVDIIINNREHKIACSAGEENRVKELATLLNEEVSKIANTIGQIGDVKLMVLAAITILDKNQDILDDAVTGGALSKGEDANRNVVSPHHQNDLSSKLDLSEIETAIIPRNFEASNLKSRFQFIKNEVWVLPASVSATNVSSENSEIVKNLDFSAIGRWGKKSSKCSLLDIQKNTIDCDKLIHLTNIDFFARDGLGALKFQGDGICVTPRAGCRQKIVSTIMAKDTAQIFSNIISSGTVNPLVGGIILV